MPAFDELPPWLNDGKHLDAETATAVRLLLKQCLTYFRDDEPRRIILMAASAIRRILRASAVTNETEWRLSAPVRVAIRQKHEISRQAL